MVQRVRGLLDGLMRREMVTCERVAKNVVAVIEAGGAEDELVLVPGHTERLPVSVPREPFHGVVRKLGEILFPGLILCPADAHQFFIEEDIRLGKPRDAVRPDAGEEGDGVGSDSSCARWWGWIVKLPSTPSPDSWRERH